MYLGYNNPQRGNIAQHNLMIQFRFSQIWIRLSCYACQQLFLFIFLARSNPTWETLFDQDICWINSLYLKHISRNHIVLSHQIRDKEDLRFSGVHDLLPEIFVNIYKTRLNITKGRCSDGGLGKKSKQICYMVNKIKLTAS